MSQPAPVGRGPALHFLTPAHLKDSEGPDTQVPAGRTAESRGAHGNLLRKEIEGPCSAVNAPLGASHTSPLEQPRLVKSPEPEPARRREEYIAAKDAEQAEQG